MPKQVRTDTTQNNKHERNTIMKNAIFTPEDFVLNLDLSKCLFTKGGNIKLGNMWVFSKLYGKHIFYVREYDIEIQGTCCGCCDGCEPYCYVQKSYRYGSVIKGHAVRTVAMRSRINELFDRLDKQITRARKKPDFIRIDQSGEIETREELINWIELARKHPEVGAFYLYTKRYKILEEVLNEYGNENIPKNVTTLISIWHKEGIAAFKKLQHFDCVKAFVYMDGFDYEAEGIHVRTMCKAYDKNGKLNHDITCDKCRKCFDRLDSHKIIGCDAH